MKKPSDLSQRIVSSCFLSSLGYLFIRAVEEITYRPNQRLLFVAAILSALLFGVYGFIKGYRNLLLSIDAPNIFPARCVAGILSIMMSIILMNIIVRPIVPNVLDPTPFYVSLVGLIFFLFGFFYLYRILLLPKLSIKSSSESISIKSRIFAAGWFGGPAFIITNVVFKDASNMQAFITLLTAYLGYIDGYRIPFIPSRSILRIVLIGFINASFVVLAVAAILSLTEVFSVDATLPSHLSSLFSIVTTTLATMTVIMVVSSFIYGTVGILAALIYFLLAAFILRFFS